MKREMQLSAGTMIAGFLLCAFGATSRHGYLINTISIVVGLILLVCGFIAFILILKKRKPQRKEPET